MKSLVNIAAGVLLLAVIQLGISLLGGRAKATTGSYNLPQFSCPAGQFVSGARWGRFVCSAPVPPKRLELRGYGQ